MPAKVSDIRTPIIDEFGELDRRVKEFAPTAARHKALREQISGWFAHDPAELDAQVDGRVYRVVATARKKQRRIASMAQLFRRLGKTIFLKLCSVTLTDVESHIPEDERTEFLIEERTGPRSISAVLIAPAGKTAA